MRPLSCLRRRRRRRRRRQPKLNRLSLFSERLKKKCHRCVSRCCRLMQLSCLSLVIRQSTISGSELTVSKHARLWNEREVIHLRSSVPIIFCGAIIITYSLIPQYDWPPLPTSGNVDLPPSHPPDILYGTLSSLRRKRLTWESRERIYFYLVLKRSIQSFVREKRSESAHFLFSAATTGFFCHVRAQSPRPHCSLRQN